MNVIKENEEQILRQASAYLPMFKETYQKYGTDAFIEEIHAFCQMLLDKSGMFKETSCQGSCSFCCHDTIMMSKIEAKYIANKIRLNNIKPDEVRKKLQQDVPKESLNFMARACPMLLDENEEGKRLCSIYEFRPLICRTHNAKTEAKYCNRVEYPNFHTTEGRLIETDAITFALAIMEQQLGLTFPGTTGMIPMHELDLD